MLTMWFQMLYIFLLDDFLLNSQFAAFHGRRVTVMPKDSHLIARIINLWDHGSFLSQFATGDGPLYNQKLHARNTDLTNLVNIAPMMPLHHITEARHLASVPAQRPT
jgi:hypothetical protein